jgi:beta-phosphoglucomutase-like phosphatase (HAD superfamily)
LKYTCTIHTGPIVNWITAGPKNLQKVKPRGEFWRRVPNRQLATRSWRAEAPISVDSSAETQSTLAIATTTYRGNIDALLAAALGNDWAKSFAAIVASDEVLNKKPAPDVYLEVLSRLNCRFGVPRD